MVTSKNVLPVAWQVAQGVPLTAVWTALSVQEFTKVLVPEWQAPQSAVAGIWVVGLTTTP